MRHAIPPMTQRYPASSVRRETNRTMPRRCHVAETGKRAILRSRAFRRKGRLPDWSSEQAIAVHIAPTLTRSKMNFPDYRRFRGDAHVRGTLACRRISNGTPTAPVGSMSLRPIFAATHPAAYPAARPDTHAATYPDTHSATRPVAYPAAWPPRTAPSVRNKGGNTATLARRGGKAALSARPLTLWAGMQPHPPVGAEARPSSPVERKREGRKRSPLRQSSSLQRLGIRHPSRASKTSAVLHNSIIFRGNLEKFSP